MKNLKKRKKQKNIELSGVKSICTKCNEEKPIEYFEKNGKDSKGNIRYRCQCRQCRSEMRKKVFNSNKLISI